jgi:hypothetical protein
MPTKDGITPDHPLPVFLSDAEEPEQPGIWRAWDTPLISTQLLKTSILGVTAAAIVFALLLVGNPLVLFANAPALLADLSAPKPGTDASTPIIQPTAGTQAFPPTASEAAPTGDEAAAAFKTAYQNQAEIREPEAESLLNRFQTWAAEEDARARAAPAQPVQDDAQSQPVQDAEPQPVADAEPEVRHLRKHRQVRREQNARAEIRTEQNLLAKLRQKPHAQGQVRPVQDARIQDRPVQDARTQDRPTQDTQAPSLWQSLGLRN